MLFISTWGNSEDIVLKGSGQPFPPFQEARKFALYYLKLCITEAQYDIIHKKKNNKNNNNNNNNNNDKLQQLVTILT